MTLRTILVCLTGVPSAAPLLRSAALLANRDQAHVIGLFVTESLVVYPSIAMHVPEDSFRDFAASQRTLAGEIEAIFEAQTAGQGFPAEWRHVNAESGYMADSIVECARGADLVMMSQENDGEGHYTPTSLQERVIKGCGRPVLIVPQDLRPETIGQSAVLGWSDTREATRAMHDLLDVLAPDARIRVLRVGKTPSKTLADHAANDLAAALARHGPKVEVVHRGKNGDGVAEILNQEAFEAGADMIATGAFGHSRVYDFVIGAATRSLLRDARLPVLFSK